MSTKKAAKDKKTTPKASTTKSNESKKRNKITEVAKKAKQGKATERLEPSKSHKDSEGNYVCVKYLNSRCYVIRMPFSFLSSAIISFYPDNYESIPLLTLL